MEYPRKGRTTELTGRPKPLDHFKTLEIIQSRVKDLRTNLHHQENHQQVYYTIDFSEVYAYLHCDTDAVKSISVSLDSSHPNKASNQHWLGLMHLFNTFTDGGPVYLLPPYTQELWSYVRTMGNKADPMRDLQMVILEETRSLPPMSLKMIESIGDPDKISPDQWETIFNLVKNNFERLAVDVSELVSWFVRGNELKKLIEKAQLSYRIDHILAEQQCHITRLAQPSSEEEEKVFEIFPTTLKAEKRYAKKIDARAIIYLRNLNKALQGTNSKAVFITRDQAILKVAQCLAKESWFAWDDICDHIYGIETVFLDLILQGTTTAEEKFIWIENVIMMLDDMKESVSKLSQEDAAAQSSNTPELASAAEEVMSSASQRWDETINTRLSLVLDKTPWLGEHFQLTSVTQLDGRDMGALLEKSGKRGREYNLLKKLWMFISKPEYREIADKHGENVWAEFMREQWSMNFLRKIKEVTESPDLYKQLAQKIGKVLAEGFSKPHGFSKTVLQSKSSAIMPSLQFISPTFQDLLKGLRPWDQSAHKQFNDIGDTFFRIVSEATVADEPESFLFMGFVLGMFDLWAEAMQVAELARKLEGQIRLSELDYFISFAKCRIAGMNPRPHSEAAQDAAQLYLEAAEYIAQARRASPYDPRYMKQDATVSLLYYEDAKKFGDDPAKAMPRGDLLADANIKPWPEAIGLLEEALEQTNDDRRLRVEILNNLAYAVASGETPSLDKAEAYVRQMESELNAAKAEETPSIPVDDWPSVEDTRLWIKALIARSRQDGDTIEQCISQQKQLISRKDLMPNERRAAENNLYKMRQWLNELPKRAKEPEPALKK